MFVTVAAVAVAPTVVVRAAVAIIGISGRYTSTVRFTLLSLEGHALLFVLIRTIGSGGVGWIPGSVSLFRRISGLHIMSKLIISSITRRQRRFILRPYPGHCFRRYILRVNSLSFVRRDIPGTTGR